MEKEGNKIPVGIIFMGRSLGELLELKARCRRRLDFLEKYKGKISSYVYEKLCQEYSSYLEAVGGEVALGLADYEIKLSEIQLFSNQLKLLDKTYAEKIQELALRHALGEYTKEQYDRLCAEHTERMKGFAETIEKYHGEERKLAEFLEKVAGEGMISELEAKPKQTVEAASQETIGWSMDKAAEAETAFREKVAEQPDEPLEEPAVLAETGLKEKAPVAESQASEPERLADEQTPPQAEKEIEEEAPVAAEISQEVSPEELLVESIERVADHEVTEPEAIDLAPEEITPDLLEESPAPQEEAEAVSEDAGQVEGESGAVEQDMAPTAADMAPQPEEPQGEDEVEPASDFKPEEDHSAGMTDLQGLQSLEEEKKQEAELPQEERSQAGEPVSQEQKSTSSMDLDTIFEESATEGMDTQAEPSEETQIAGESAEHIEEEEASPPEEVLPEETTAPPSEKEEKYEEVAMESAPLDLDAIMSAAGTVVEKEELPAPVSAEDLKAGSETGPPEPATEVAEGQKPEPEGIGVSHETPEEQQSTQTVEQAPASGESAEKAEKESEQISPEPLDESVESGEAPDSSAMPQEEAPKGRDDKDSVIDHAVSLDDKVDLKFDLGGRDNDTEKMLTVDQTIDAIKKKTVKCPKCDTMNYSIRWYCENCKATLTSL